MTIIYCCPRTFCVFSFHHPSKNQKEPIHMNMDTIVNLANTRGFVFPGSEIYGGLANTWDYGPLGIALKNNVKAAWWKKFIQESPYNVGIDAAILMNPKTWE